MEKAIAPVSRTTSRRSPRSAVGADAAVPGGATVVVSVSGVAELLKGWVHSGSQSAGGAAGFHPAGVPCATSAGVRAPGHRCPEALRGSARMGPP
ncbi:hypothetical protein GCM10023329_42620 [Streptomyces sanyensis]|uniref:Uncharacterized protein n=1 Tax=Streptomyces sanyensis TaxID=568869 RepID=A0ABP9B0C2_9ACTN